MRSRPDPSRPPSIFVHSPTNIPTYCQLKSQQLASRLVRTPRSPPPAHFPTPLSQPHARTLPPPPSLQLLRQRHSQLQNLHGNCYQELQGERERLAGKARKSGEERSNLQNSLQSELEGTRCVLDQISLRTAHQQPSLPQALQLTDLLLTPPRTSPIRRRRSRAMASPLIDASLLLSCKKEEEDYVTLKYSEESNLLRHRHRSSEPISEEKHIRRISEEQEHPQRAQTSQPEQHQRIWSQLEEEKEKVSVQGQQIRQAINSYEQLLDRIVGEVAEEKVEGEIGWAHLIADTDHSLAHLRSLLHEQCNSTHRFYLSFHQSLSELEVTLSSRSLAEASARRSCLSTAVGRLAGEGRE